MDSVAAFIGTELTYTADVSTGMNDLIKAKPEHITLVIETNATGGHTWAFNSITGETVNTDKTFNYTTRNFYI
jgi:predicted secreted protein